MPVTEPATTAAAGEQTTEELEVTVRVTGNAAGTLRESVIDRLQSIPRVADATIQELVDVSPGHGEMRVTVTATVTVPDAAVTAEVVEVVDSATCVTATIAEAEA